jgi:hypothetical protein
MIYYTWGNIPQMWLQLATEGYLVNNTNTENIQLP